jgi:hypothetical protein
LERGNSPTSTRVEAPQARAIAGAEFDPLGKNGHNPGVSQDESRYELPEPERWLPPGTDQSFDRIAFARRALACLGHARLTVLFYHTAHRMRVRQGRDLRRGWDARWAFVGIPPRASREEIVLSLVDLLGEPVMPWVVGLVMLGAAEQSH